VTEIVNDPVFEQGVNVIVLGDSVVFSIVYVLHSGHIVVVVDVVLVVLVELLLVVVVVGVGIITAVPNRLQSGAIVVVELVDTGG